NASLSKNWEGTSNSMSVNINRTQNLITGSITNTLPSISFNHSQSYPFRFGKQKNTSESSYSWYEMIGMNYGASAQRIDNKTRSVDTLPFIYDQRQGINHNLSFNFAPKAGYFTIAPQFSYNEKWYDKSLTYKGLDTLGRPILVDKYGFAAVRTFSTGVSISTKLYGMLNSPIPGLSGFRHTITPVVSYTYIPDFSEKQYGYFGRYKDKFGNEQKFDRFAKGLYGSASAYESQSIGMSVGNVFETKTSAKDTTEKEQKYQLLNLGASASYNFVADTLKFSQISTSFRTDIGTILGIGGSANFNLYEFDQTAKTRVNRYLIEQGKGIAQLTYFSLSLSTSLRGEKKLPETQQDVDDSARVADNERNQNFSGYKGIYDSPEPDFSIPWSLSLSFNFSQSQDNPNQKFRSANVSGSLDFNLTENWKFTASSSYDIVSKQFAAPQMNISRDLHCWLMNFQWSPIGPYSGYRFEIKVKAPQLQDIKLTKQNNDRL
ncbi:MAG: putative LPS assembly protein LptD, partial [Bacteroidota bacterium]|nr:putative LPS assembly protein LptD [Bacteroidota bacterium]